MRALITGGAGFIGSNMAERLLAEGHKVTVIDNLCGGRIEFLGPMLGHPSFRFLHADLLDLHRVERAMENQEIVFHLAANSDIPAGRRQTDVDLRLGTLATYNVLEAMRRAQVRKLAFASSSVVYGEAAISPTPEDYGPLLPISLYGASKLACEGLISAFCHNYGLQAWIFRFANICGRHGTHGILFDMIHRLQANSRRLEVLGDGQQSKPYLHVSECIDGILFAIDAAGDQLNFFNLGAPGSTSAECTARLLLEVMQLRQTELTFTGGHRGWPGDVARVQLDCAKLADLGWKAKRSSYEAVALAASELVEELACKLSS
jgi:UDP-glucose 4-epimerase